MKRMKKRRDLDALVNGKTATGRRKKKGQHELLRNESESSEVEEFSIPQKTVVRNGQGICRFCAKCVTVCGFFLLLACLSAVGGLLWVHVELKKEVDDLKTRIDAVKNLPGELGTIHSRLGEVEEKLNVIQTGEGGLQRVQDQVTKLQSQLSKMNATLKEVSKGSANAPEILAVPETVKGLSKSVADLGSNLETVKQEVSELAKFKDLITTEVNSLSSLVQNSETRDAPTAPGMTTRKSKGGPVTPPPTDGASKVELYKYVAEEVAKVTHDLGTMNTSLWVTIGTMKAHSEHHVVQISKLENKTSDLETRLGLVELKKSVGEASSIDTEAVVQQAVHNVLEEMRNLTEVHSGPVNQQELEGLAERVNNVSAVVHKLQEQVQENEENDENLMGEQKTLESMLTTLTGNLTELRGQQLQQVQQLNASLESVRHGLMTVMETLHQETATTKLPALSGTVVVPTTPRPTEFIKEKTPDQPPVEVTTQTIPEKEQEDPWFLEMDQDGDGLVSYGDIERVMGPDTPPVAVMRLHDVNQDGMYTYDDVAEATQPNGDRQTFRTNEGVPGDEVTHRRTGRSARFQNLIKKAVQKARLH